MSGMLTIAGYALRESLRRRVFLVVLVLTAAFLALYGLGCAELFADIESFEEQDDFETREIVGSTVFGLAMFTTLFLGTVLAVFLTLSVVRGDAESGLLQPLVVRPVGRSTLLAGRLLAAATVCAAYVLVVYGVAALLTNVTGDWWPDRPLASAAGLAGAVVIIAAIALLGSVFLSGVANGIAVFMTFGAGLTAGLLGQIGEALNSDRLEQSAEIASWVLPFEALYQGALYGLTADTSGLEGFIVRLGPFGGAQEAGPPLALWSLFYLAAVTWLAMRAFERRDL